MGSFRRRLSLLASDVVLDGETRQIGPAAMSCFLGYGRGGNALCAR